MHALVFATEGLSERTLWYPTILGVLVVIAAVALFCGTVYLLLATNLGARLGFLVAAAALTGFMVLLSALWLTTQFPLTTLKGRAPSWEAVESLENADTAQSRFGPVRTIETEGKEVDATEAANVKAAVDQIVVISEEAGDEEAETGEEGDFAIYQQTTDYIVTSTREVGGGGQFKVDFSEFPPSISFHKPAFAVVTICPVDLEAQEVPFGEPIPEPQCRPDAPETALVLERDLGSLRVPPLVSLIGSTILFALCLLGLHWRERDLRELARREAAGSSVPVPANA